MHCNKGCNVFTMSHLLRTKITISTKNIEIIIIIYNTSYFLSDRSIYIFIYIYLFVQCDILKLLSTFQKRNLKHKLETFGLRTSRTAIRHLFHRFHLLVTTSMAIKCKENAAMKGNVKTSLQEKNNLA